VNDQLRASAQRVMLPAAWKAKRDEVVAAEPAPAPTGAQRPCSEVAPVFAAPAI